MASGLETLSLEGGFPKQRREKFTPQHICGWFAFICAALFFAHLWGRSSPEGSRAAATTPPPVAPKVALAGSNVAVQRGVVVTRGPSERPSVSSIITQLGNDISNEQSLLAKAESTAKKEEKALKDGEGQLKSSKKTEKDLEQELHKGQMGKYRKDSFRDHWLVEQAQRDRQIEEKQEKLVKQQAADLARSASRWPDEQDLQSLGDGASWFEKTHADLEKHRVQLQQRAKVNAARGHKLDQHISEAFKEQKHLQEEVHTPKVQAAHKVHKAVRKEMREEIKGDVGSEEATTREGKLASQELKAALKDFEHLVKRQEKDTEKGSKVLGHHKTEAAKTFAKDEDKLEAQEKIAVQKAEDALKRAHQDESSALAASRRWKASYQMDFPRLARKHAEAEKRRAKIKGELAELEKKLKKDLSEEGKIHKSAETFHRKLHDES